MSAVSYFSILSVLSSRSHKAKSQKSFPLKSARNCPPEKVVRSQKSAKPEKSVYVEKKGQFLKDFSIQICLFFPFQLCPLTTEAMGIGGLRERSLSHSDKVNAGAKTAKSTLAAQST